MRKPRVQVRRARRVAIRSAIAEGGLYAVALILTVWTATLAKQSRELTPLVAVDSAGFIEQAVVIDASDRTPLRQTESETAGASEPAVDIEFTEYTGDPEIRFYKGRPVRPARVMLMTVTAYSPDYRSCGIYADGITASGKTVHYNAGELVAADTRYLPFGSLLSIPGYADERIVPVLDVGGAIKGSRLDVLYPTHERALQWGVQRLAVTVWEYVDED